MKIAFLFKRDSHFKAVKSTALRVCAQYNCEPVFIGIDSDYSPSNEVYSVFHIDKQDLTSLHEYEYVVACLGGYLLNQVVFALRDTNTKVISIFPGIVSHYQLDAFISRLNADQVWLNSKADFDLYSNICNIFKHSNNGMLYGMSWLNLENFTNSNSVSETSEAIFFEQTEILLNANSKLKQRFIDTLEEIITSNLVVKFKYKIRDNSTDQYFILLREHLSQFENVEIVKELADINVLQAKYYLSVSSSALVEGIVYGKDSYIVDTELLDPDSKEFYRNSNIELRNPVLTHVSSSMNNKWYKQRVFLPITNVDLSYINKKHSLINLESRNYNFIRLIIFRLAFFYPKLMHLAFNRSRLKAYQKSFEYLSKHSYE